MINIHEIVPNIDDITDAEFETVKIKFFEIFGEDKNPADISYETERLDQTVIVYCRFQNNDFVVNIQY